MKYVKSKINSLETFLEQQEDGSWKQVNTAPQMRGEYPVEISAEDDAGNTATVNDLLRVEGIGESESRMIGYLPMCWKQLPQIQEVLKVEGLELDTLFSCIRTIPEEALILSASEWRIKQWEKRLKIISAGTLDQRKQYILAMLRGQGKLNESKIKQMVNTFTGGTATVEFANSYLTVKVLPPSVEDYRFEDVERALEPKVPAHIGLIIKRHYDTWGGIANAFASFGVVAQEKTWLAVKNHIPY